MIQLKDILNEIINTYQIEGTIISNKEENISKKYTFTKRASEAKQPVVSSFSSFNKENRENREKNRQKYRERLQELEKRVEAMKRELQKYGVIFIPTTCQ
jgi:predicted RNase H-like nuclease (RuvC/YqgF family)